MFPNAHIYTNTPACNMTRSKPKKSNDPKWAVSDWGIWKKKISPKILPIHPFERRCLGLVQNVSESSILNQSHDPNGEAVNGLKEARSQVLHVFSTIFLNTRELNFQVNSPLIFIVLYVSIFLNALSLLKIYTFQFYVSKAEQKKSLDYMFEIVHFFHIYGSIHELIKYEVKVCT